MWLNVIGDGGDGYAAVALKAHAAERFGAELRAPNPTPALKLVPRARRAELGILAFGGHGRGSMSCGSSVRPQFRRSQLEGRALPQRTGAGALNDCQPDGQSGGNSGYVPARPPAKAQEIRL